MKVDDVRQNPSQCGFRMSRLAERCRLSLLRGGALMILLNLMAGCVTEYSGGTQMSSDPDATLDKRVAVSYTHLTLPTKA